MKKILIAATVLIIAIFSGCSSVSSTEFKPDENAVFIKRDGTFQSSIVVEASGDYTAEGLREYAQREVDEFNSFVADETAVSIVSVNAEGGKLKLILSYKNFDMMLKFAQRTKDDTMGISNIRIMSVKDAIAMNLTSGLPDEALKKKEAYLVIIDGSNRIYTEGKILFVQGENATRISDYTALSGGSQNFIVFE